MEQMRTRDPESAPEDHLRHPAIRGRASVLRKSLQRRSHRLVAALREGLCADPELRLRQPGRRTLARSVSEDARSTDEHVTCTKDTDRQISVRGIAPRAG